MIAIDILPHILCYHVLLDIELFDVLDISIYTFTHDTIIREKHNEKVRYHPGKSLMRHTQDHANYITNLLFFCCNF